MRSNKRLKLQLNHNHRSVEVDHKSIWWEPREGSTTDDRQLHCCLSLSVSLFIESWNIERILSPLQLKASFFNPTPHLTCLQLLSTQKSRTTHYVKIAFSLHQGQPIYQKWIMKGFKSLRFISIYLISSNTPF